MAPRTAAGAPHSPGSQRVQGHHGGHVGDRQCASTGQGQLPEALTDNRTVLGEGAGGGWGGLQCAGGQGRQTSSSLTSGCPGRKLSTIHVVATPCCAPEHPRTPGGQLLAQSQSPVTNPVAKAWLLPSSTKVAPVTAETSPEKAHQKQGLVFQGHMQAGFSATQLALRDPMTRDSSFSPRFFR